MSNDKLRTVFSTALGIPVEQVTEALAYRSIPQWDSVSHMALIASLEGEYNIMLETEDVIDMSSVAKAREILTKYGVSA